MAALTPTTPLPLLIVLLALSGVFRSIGFSAYNSLAFADVEPARMTPANTLMTTRAGARRRAGRARWGRCCCGWAGRSPRSRGCPTTPRARSGSRSCCWRGCSCVPLAQVIGLSAVGGGRGHRPGLTRLEARCIPRAVRAHLPPCARRCRVCTDRCGRWSSRAAPGGNGVAPRRRVDSDHDRPGLARARTARPGRARPRAHRQRPEGRPAALGIPGALVEIRRWQERIDGTGRAGAGGDRRRAGRAAGELESDAPGRRRWSAT